MASMGKKKKSLQKHLKKQQIQELTKGPVNLTQIKDSAPPTSQNPVESDQKMAKNTHLEPVDNDHSQELRKTFISVVVILILFAAALYFDQQRDFLGPLGDQLYQKLRLAQS